MTPAEGLARHQPGVWTLSESCAVVAHRKQTFAVRNGAKFRRVFSIFGRQTLSSRHIFLAIRPPCGSMVRFWAMTGRMMAEAWDERALSSRPVERIQTPLAVPCRPNGTPMCHSTPWRVVVGTNSANTDSVG
jgi:hypothetical protein